MKKCYATKNNGKTCFANVTAAWPAQTCHIHDPNGKFRQQLKAKGMGKSYVVKCEHKWYMREEGIQCEKCLLVWQKGMD
jgi:hypothetical protein